MKHLLVPKWTAAEAINIDPPEVKLWFLGFDVESSTRGKYKSIMSGVYSWGQCEGLIPRGEQFNPCRYVKGREFSQVTGYEALVLEIEDIFKVLSELQQPVYELALLIATCGLRISEALGLRWRNILWESRVDYNPGNLRSFSTCKTVPRQSSPGRGWKPLNCCSMLLQLGGRKRCTRKMTISFFHPRS